MDLLLACKCTGIPAFGVNNISQVRVVEQNPSIGSPWSSKHSFPGPGHFTVLEYESICIFRVCSSLCSNDSFNSWTQCTCKHRYGTVLQILGLVSKTKFVSSSSTELTKNCFYLYIYLINRLTAAKDKVHSSLDGTSLVIMSTFVIPKCILQPVKPAPIEECFVTTDPCCSCWNPRVRMDRAII